MAIKRIEFLGFVVMGPRHAAKGNYKPDEWSKWEARYEGAFIHLDGEGRRIVVPRSRCIVYEDLSDTKADGKGHTVVRRDNK